MRHRLQLVRIGSPRLSCGRWVAGVVGEREPILQRTKVREFAGACTGRQIGVLDEQLSQSDGGRLPARMGGIDGDNGELTGHQGVQVTRGKVGMPAEAIDW